MMKSFWACLAFFSAGAQTVVAVQTLPFHEPFPYANNTLLGTTPTTNIWNIGNTGTSGGASVANPGLEYPGIVSSSSNRLQISGTPGSNRNKGATFTPQILGADNPVVYASFLLNVTTLPSANRLFTGLATNASGTGASGAAGMWIDPNGRLLLSKSSTSTPTGTNSGALGIGTHLIVLRYKWNSGSGDDQFALWVNPSSLGATEGNVPAPLATTTNGADIAFLQSFWIFHPNDSSVVATLQLDEIRVGTNWADVTPTGFVAPPSQPVITEVMLNPGGVVIRGTNGTAGGPYLILRSTNIASPQFPWTPILTNTFAADGSFDVTNPLSPTDVQQLYRVLVGNEPPPTPIAPSITAHPTNRTTIVGNDTTFNVIATGTAPLRYLWYFNTNTLVLDSASSSLTITNAQMDDAGIYSVLVTNAVGSATGSNAVLTVIPPPVAPFILSQPTNQMALAGDPATFSVIADGDFPLRYQWFFNTNTLLIGKTNHLLEFASVHPTNEGYYSVRITNIAGSMVSTNAYLTVLSKPFITIQPESQTVTISNNAAFSVTAIGTPFLRYQWYFNTNTLLLNDTNASLVITNAQTNNMGGYSVVITNGFGATTSIVAQLKVSASLPDNAFNLYGFGGPTVGGGIIPESDPNYRKVFNPGDLRLALANNNTKVIEIMNDLNLGWNELAASNRTGAFRQSDAPLLHPTLITSGVTTVDIQNKNGLTIFSTNGATIRHAEFNIKNTHNILVRNLKFDELWEWDETSSPPGAYDENDWDFITIGDGGNCTNVWIDHCDFTKSYDGTVDMKGGDNHVTISWCRFLGDDGGPDSFVRRQFMHFETNGVTHPLYSLLRTNGFSVEDMVAIVRSQKKGHLVGQSNLRPENAGLHLTLHHNYYFNFQDRIPRLRGGNSHVYNVYVNNTEALAAKRLRDQRVAAMNSSARNILNADYSFNVTLNGSISTEDGAVLLEKSHMVDVLNPLRNNQTNPSDPAFTGKIRAEDTIYTLDAVTIRGNTEDPGTELDPIPATPKPFSWNGFVDLPYSYVVDDPSVLAEMLSNGTAAGAGVLTWSKTNWFKTTY
jgi:pectate lyase